MQACKPAIEKARAIFHKRRGLETTTSTTSPISSKAIVAAERASASSCVPKPDPAQSLALR